MLLPLEFRRSGSRRSVGYELCMINSPISDGPIYRCLRYIASKSSVSESKFRYIHQMHVHWSNWRLRYGKDFDKIVFERTEVAILNHCLFAIIRFRINRVRCSRRRALAVFLKSDIHDTKEDYVFVVLGSSATSSV